MEKSHDLFQDTIPASIKGLFPQRTSQLEKLVAMN
jgi:hypothetical protein